MHDPRKGFTLIELLIVVAIIAILAAIAVPNFLEAQTRSKVSRVKADQRSLATAIEAYTVDYNRPPLCFRFEISSSEYVKIYGSNGTDFGAAKLRERASLTTPVSYITNWPDDPFATKGVVWQYDGTPNEYPWYRYEDYELDWWRSDIVHGMGYRWALGSPGPTRYSYLNIIRALRGAENHSNEPGKVYFPYDPTNGTLSEGLIVRTNKGIWTQMEY